jgi:hypothetical protein
MDRAIKPLGGEVGGHDEEGGCGGFEEVDLGLLVGVVGAEVEDGRGGD